MKTIVNQLNRFLPFSSFLGLMLMLVALSNAALAQSVAEPVDAPSNVTETQTFEVFEKAVSKTQKVTFGYNREAARIAVVIEDGKHLAGYLADKVEDPNGTFELTLKREFGGEGAAKTLTINLSYSDRKAVHISFAGDELLSFTDSVEFSQVTTELAPGVCTRSNGPCDQVNDDRAWWRCFWCCAAVGC